MFKIGDPQYWRHRAEEAGTLADELTDPEAKRKMLKSPSTMRRWRYVPHNGCASILQMRALLRALRAYQSCS
jgi:hypothetical protein